MTPILTDFETLFSNILSEISLQIPDFQTVELYGGQFNEDDVKKYGFKVPACFVFPLQMTPSSHPDSRAVDVNFEFAAYVVAKGDRATKGHSAQCMNLTNSLFQLVKNNTFSTSGVRKAIVNSPASWINSNNGVTIWSVRWTNAILLACQ